MTKRQKKGRNYRYYYIAMTFALLIIAYSNCSDIRLIGSGRINLPSVSNSPEKTDLETFGPIDTKCYPNNDQLGYGSLQFWPLNPARSLNFQGTDYSINVAGNVSCSSKEIFDFSDATYENGGVEIGGAGNVRVRRFSPAALSFRIVLPQSQGYLKLLYQGIISHSPGIAPDVYYSISRYAGDVDPNRPNSDEYCNGYQAAVTTYQGPTQYPGCRLKPGLVYYFNVLDTYVSATGYDPGGMLIMFSYKTIDCANFLTNIPIGSPAAYLCPKP